MRDAKWSLAVTVQPAQEPVPLDDVKSFVREDGTEQNGVLSGMITAVRASQEDVLGRALLTQTRVLRMDRFPCGAIEIPVAPVQSITSITYVDAAGDTQTLYDENTTDAVQINTHSTPARIVPAYGTSWPSTRCVENAVVVTLVAGYGDDPDDVPHPLRSALLMRVADMYENREAKITGTIQSENPTVAAMESPYRLYWF